MTPSASKPRARSSRWLNRGRRGERDPLPRARSGRGTDCPTARVRRWSVDEPTGGADVLLLAGKRPGPPTTPDPPPADVLEPEFDRLAHQWRSDTGFQSSVARIAMHPAYQRIIAMGPAVLPLILRELENEPGHWMWALKYLAGKDVAEGEETLDGARRAWLHWGHEQHLMP